MIISFRDLSGTTDAQPANSQIFHKPALMRQNHCLFVQVCCCILAILYFGLVALASKVVSLEDILSKADDLMLQGQLDQAVAVYQMGIDQHQAAANNDNNNDDDDDNNDDDDDDDDDNYYSLTVLLSLYTNLGTALSSMDENVKAADCYQSALQVYQREIMKIEEKSQKQEATAIAASAAFYLGMVHQDLGLAKDAVESYGLALQLDDHYWAAAANLGSVQQDVLKDYQRALASYNQAYSLLTGKDPPTDPPDDPQLVLSQLQYRIGLCITYSAATQKCVVQDEPDRPVDCRELATHAFSLAVQYDPTNEFAKHMLASITADASMTRASNVYVKALFDEYAINFEHSLVKELQYTGFERLRRGFDRAMNGATKVFDTVVDAGCGTGLAREQFRNVSKTLIGVDLSQAILDQAVLQRPGLYDQVIVGDLLQAFQDKAPLSLIIAADSYIYFGNLDPLFEAMHQCIEVGGLAAFTLENVSVDDEHILDTSKSEWRWQLTASGRFAHRKEYVVKASEQHGFTVQHYEPLTGKFTIPCLFNRNSSVSTRLQIRKWCWCPWALVCSKETDDVRKKRRVIALVALQVLYL